MRPGPRIDAHPAEFEDARILHGPGEFEWGAGPLPHGPRRGRRGRWRDARIPYHDDFERTPAGEWDLLDSIPKSIEWNASSPVYPRLRIPGRRGHGLQLQRAGF